MPIFDDLRKMPVQVMPCKTCPFAGERPIQLTPARYAELTENLIGQGQHLCHSANNEKICRGGREIQLRWLYLKGFITSPNDEAFNKTMDECLLLLEESK